MPDGQGLFKVLVDGEACHGGKLAWSLPADTGDGTFRPGDWHRVEPPIRVCRNGLHLTTAPLAWMVTGAMVYRAEGRGASDTDGSDKTAFAEARLLSPAPELIPEWWRSWLPFVREEIPATPFFRPDGSPDPAWRLFTAPSWSAAESAAWLAARSAAGSTAESAAWSAAWSAVRSAAESAARSAAWSAAWLAAMSAAGSTAESAAESAARSAAWSAAESAARSAALLASVAYVCADLDIAPEHRDHARARWNVWRKGYALLDDVGGVLYCYGVDR